MTINHSFGTKPQAMPCQSCGRNITTQIQHKASHMTYGVLIYFSVDIVLLSSDVWQIFQGKRNDCTGWRTKNRTLKKILSTVYLAKNNNNNDSK